MKPDKTEATCLVGKKTQLYLHIGHPKSGSTTLQSFLFQNWRHIDACGFKMPSAEFEIDETAAEPGNPIVALQQMKETGDTSRLVNWIDHSARHADKLLISSECLFEDYWPDVFARLADRCDVHVIYYVRRQDQVLLSAWRQWGLKRGLSLDEFLRRRLKNPHPVYVDNLAPWLDKVGAKSAYTRFISSKFLTNGSLLEDVSNLLGIEGQLLGPVEDQNVSLDARLLHFMSARPEMFASVHDDSILSLLSSAADHNPQRLYLTNEQFEAIQKTFEDSNQLLLARHHPEMHGTTVIEASTAPISNKDAKPSEDEQREFVRACLMRVAHTNDQRLLALKLELGV
jgi:hypothetical protein